MAGLARNISGNRSLTKAKSNKEVNQLRRDGLDSSSCSFAYRKRISKRLRAEAEFNQSRTVSGLKGYYNRSSMSPCVTYTKDQIDSLNKEKGIATGDEFDLLCPKRILDKDDIKKIRRDAYKKDEWIDKDLKPALMSTMTTKRIEFIINGLLKRKKKGIMSAFDRKWLRKFVKEIDKRV